MSTTLTALDAVTDILDTDLILIEHANGSGYKMSGADLNKRNQVIIASSKTITGTPLKTGNVVRVLFTADITAANGSTALTINYNTVNYTVKVCKNGALANYNAFLVGSTYKYCQAYTTLEFIYDGSNFVILGNPVVISDTSSTIFADGLKRVDVVTAGDKNLVTSGAVDSIINEKTAALPKDAVLHYSFDDVPDYPDGSADVRLLNNNTYDIQSGDYRFRNNGGTSFANENGNLKITTVSTTSTDGVYISSTITINKMIKIKFNILSLTEGGYVYLRSGNTTDVLICSEIGEYEVCFLHNPTSQYKNVYLFISSGATSEIIIEQIYIGDGSYSTPIIDNTDGQNNATNNGGIAVQGVSGKGINFNGVNSYIQGNLPWTPYDKKVFSFSCWVRNWDMASAFMIINNWSTYAISTLQLTLNQTSTYKITIAAVMPDGKINRYANTSFQHTSDFFVCGIFNGADSKVYINGVSIPLSLIDTTTPSSAIQSRKFFQSGRFCNTSGYSYSKADIDDFLIFDRALSEQEVLALYLNKANIPKYYDLNNYKLPEPPAADGTYSLKVNVASGVQTYSWV